MYVCLSVCLIDYFLQSGTILNASCYEFGAIIFYFQIWKQS